MLPTIPRVENLFLSEYSLSVPPNFCGFRISKIMFPKIIGNRQLFHQNTLKHMQIIISKVRRNNEGISPPPMPTGFRNLSYRQIAIKSPKSSWISGFKDHVPQKLSVTGCRPRVSHVTFRSTSLPKPKPKPRLGASAIWNSRKGDILHATEHVIAKKIREKMLLTNLFFCLFFSVRLIIITVVSICLYLSLSVILSILLSVYLSMYLYLSLICLSL